MNDNTPPKRRVEPFHRLYAEGALDKSTYLNNSLYACGERYRKSFDRLAR
jgi:hypothetical protein